ncbi:protein of unknown function [uncultured Sphingopyxis sp.]|uniref:Transposase n=1 Tax=uncultured Sphingopyxis sp. TaxID=310581 RepID=A0A1Y5PYT5_9SPHN|nr:protein of unknown function [uncultured Sphingopyxis sp.]
MATRLIEHTAPFHVTADYRLARQELCVLRGVFAVFGHGSPCSDGQTSAILKRRWSILLALSYLIRIPLDLADARTAPRIGASLDVKRPSERRT